MSRNVKKRNRTKEEATCLECGTEIKIQKVGPAVCYGRCRYRTVTKKCIHCSRMFSARPSSRIDTCGRDCPALTVEYKCLFCRSSCRRPKRFGPGRFCDDLCRIEYESDLMGYSFSRSEYMSIRYTSARRRAIRDGDGIDRMDIFEYYGWQCHICKEFIDETLRHPDPMSATLDHVVPLALGGKHVWDNVHPAHKLCNEEKGSRAA